MAFTTPGTAFPSAVLTSAFWNTNVRDNISYLYEYALQAPACRVQKTSTQSINSATLATLSFDTELFDTDSMHSNVTNNGRITFNTAGLYVVSAGVVYATSVTRGELIIDLVPNAGGETGRIVDVIYGSGERFNCTTIYKFSAADYIEAKAFHESGTARTVNATPGTFLAAAYIGEGI